MKFLSVASTFLLFNGALSQDCPQELTESKILTTLTGDTVTFKYAVVLSPFSDSQNLFCAHIESTTDGFIGFGISPTGTMASGEAIIGIPDDASVNPGTVMKYGLVGRSKPVLMSLEDQTLMDTVITQTDDGTTLMKFSRYLDEGGGNAVILANGENTFLYALGSSSNLAYHGENKAPFTVDFGVTRPPTSSGTKPLTESPTTSGGASEVSTAYSRTMTPTGAYIERDRATPAPSPVTYVPDTPTSEATTPDTPSTDTTPPETPTPDTPAKTPTRDASMPDAPSSGAMISKKIGTMILGAGAVAVWFGM